MKNIIFFIITAPIFFVTAAFQSSFLPHIFPVPHLVFVILFLIIFFRNRTHYWWGMAYAITAGLFIDLFSLTGSSPFIGTGILSCLAAWGTIIGLDYFLQEREDSYSVVYFFIVFSLSFVAYLIVLLGIRYLL